MAATIEGIGDVFDDLEAGCVAATRMVRVLFGIVLAAVAAPRFVEEYSWRPPE